ncbi:MAG: hypothetical protein KGJ23_06205 [Euryarchaeota archaeon]|nr:hypothetical protein [Euryarchaeota archaeon]MDE1836192.1 hypothetical protein [Euryarchaeota archaeon]MDE2045445.1 hypothetical protein [Thermoplasmata archaeon]
MASGPAVPLGAWMNLVLQSGALVLLLIGLVLAIRAHRAIAEGKAEAERHVNRHMNIMTTAILLSGAGLLLWMLPSFYLGWYYQKGGLGWGTGGWQSYVYQYQSSVPLTHGWLIVIHVALGSVAAILGVYLVLRMRWSGFPEALKVRNFRAVMITTWIVWFSNVLVGYLVFYYFAYTQTYP